MIQMSGTNDSNSTLSRRREIRRDIVIYLKFRLSPTLIYYITSSIRLVNEQAGSTHTGSYKLARVVDL